MKKCPQCNQAYPAEALFCLQDGAQLTSTSNQPQNFPPTVAANSFEPAPTVAASRIPNFAPQQQAPISFGAPQPQFGGQQQFGTPQAAPPNEKPRLGWYVYPTGFVISLLIYLFLSYVVYPGYVSMMAYTAVDVGKALADETDFEPYVQTLFLVLTFKPWVYGFIALLFGFFWSKGGTKWGLIVLIPELIFRFYYLAKTAINEPSQIPLQLVILIVAFPIMVVVACLAAFIGSRLKRAMFGKNYA
jgi:hypothetical protein